MFSDIETHHSTDRGSCHREDGPKAAVVRANGQETTAVAGTNRVHVIDDVGADNLGKVKEVVEKLEAENVALHRELIAKGADHSRALMHNI